MGQGAGGQGVTRGGAPDGRAQEAEMREFMLVVRRALLLVVRWIEKRYGWHERAEREWAPSPVRDGTRRG
jgi:hypothetical protein